MARSTTRTAPAWRLPELPSRAAAAVTGLVVGALTVGLTWLLQRGCDLATGTSSCGVHAGFLLLISMVLVVGLVGGLLLRHLRVPHPGSTSALAVGLLAVVAMLFLIEVLFAWWMILVIPLVGAATYALAHTITRAADAPPG